MSNPPFRTRTVLEMRFLCYFCISPMKRFLVISYWVVSILLVAIVLTSVGYRLESWPGRCFCS